MTASTGALIVGALGLLFGLSVPLLQKRPGGSERLIAAAAVGLLVLAVVLIVVPLMMGVPW